MKETELITTADNKVFHLNIGPEDISERIIIVGDPGRVKLVASLFDNVRCEIENREFHTMTGSYHGKDVTVMSSGIGTDNIDILMNELDATVNFDLKSKKALPERRSLTIIRMGTSGGLQADIDAGSFLVSLKAVGFDGVMNYYEGIDQITDTAFEEAFTMHTGWSPRLTTPYIIDSDPELAARFTSLGLATGITVSAPGFYAPQGRSISLRPVDPLINEKLGTFEYKGMKIANYEMESSAIYGLSKLLGHKALTVCSVIGNRVTGRFINDYHPLMKELAGIVLENI